MRRSILAAILTLICAGAMASDNVAYKDANVRFTVITDGTVRMEYAPDGKFVDNQSQIAVIRDYESVPYKVKDGKWVEISTSRIRLRYRKGSGAFTSENLIVTGAKGAFQFTWKPGMEPKGNLGGTYRTLDQCDGGARVYKDRTKDVPVDLGLGVVSRDGWCLIDDSASYLFDGDPEWNWVTERQSAEGAQDWYFMAYGNDYRKALQDYARFAGKMPLPPRYAFGYWWSRYWAYSDHEVRELVQKMEEYQIPLDVLVVDMDWHYTDKVRGAWTGFSWNKSLFPDPDKFLNYLRDKDLKITLNLHPASGIKPFEVKYPDIARDLGLDPSKKEDIPWWGSDKNFIQSVFKHVLSPMEAQGVAFWWLDWQQYANDLKLQNLSNTWWINYTFFTQMEKFTPKRPMLYHRWGGLGNHRYQIGFSGDTYVSWVSLDYQPYFTSTSANVLYGFWSHDIGGHMLDYDGRLGPDSYKSVNPELYVRWMQYGALSPILRTHSTKQKEIKKEPWAFDAKTLDALRGVIQQRYAMSPYIYTLARRAHDTSVSMCYPLYYDWPEAQEAYDFRNQYMFGENMMVAPITAPAVNGYSEIRLWLPEGTWYELSSGTLLEGGRVIGRDFALDEYPVYVKAGSVLPYTGEKLDNLNGNDAAWELTVYPGGDGEFSIYEDGGNSKDYETACAWTRVSSVRGASSLTLNIGAREGSYEGMPARRRFSVRVLCSDIPASVKVDGREVAYSYDAKDLAVVVDLGGRDCARASTVEITYPDGCIDLADGTIGRARRVVNGIAEYKEERNSNRVFDDTLGNMSTFNVAVNYNPETLHALVEEFRDSYARFPEVLRQFGESQSDMEDIQWLLEKVNYKK